MPRPRADGAGAGEGAHDSVRVHTRPTSSSLGFTPVRPAHPVRAKNDRDGQVSWLAGQCRSGRLLGIAPNGIWPMAHRLQLQGQPECIRSLFIPVPGEPVALPP